MKKMVIGVIVLLLMLIVVPLIWNDENVERAPEHVAQLDTSQFITKKEKKYAKTYPHVYDALKETLTQFQPYFTYDTTSIDEETLDEMLTHIIEYSRMNTYLEGWTYWVEGERGYVEFQYSLRRDEIIQQEQFVKKEIERIAQAIIKPSMSTYEQVKAVHDYIVLHTAYDERAAEQCGEPECYDPAYSAYGLLKNNIAVCEGYAQVMTLLLDYIGIENYYVQGMADDELHAWNLVKVDDAYYYVDTTWDDPIPNKENVVEDQYLLVSVADLDDHQWDVKQYPKAAKKSYRDKRKSK